MTPMTFAFYWITTVVTLYIQADRFEQGVQTDQETLNAAAD